MAQWTNVGAGIDYRELTITMADGQPNRLFIARMDVRHTNAIIGSMIASNRVAGARERISAQAARHEDALNAWGGAWGQRNDVVVAINGSFFNLTTGVITGGHIYDGWYAKRFDNWAGQMGYVWKLDRTGFIGVCPHYRASEQTVTINGVTQEFDGINVPRTNNTLILYTPQYDFNTLTDTNGVEVLVELGTPLMILTPPNVVTGVVREVRVNQGSMLIPFGHLVLSASGSRASFLANNAQPGRIVSISQNLLLYDGPPGNLCSTPDPRTFHRAYALAQGNFHFLKNGAVQPTSNSGMIVRHPRTFIAHNATYVFFVVCDGRSTASVGMTSDEMGAFCLTNLLATEGVNLDGGGSSTLWLNGLVRNTPSDGAERTVANGLMMVNLLPRTNTTTFAPGQSVRTATTANLRLGPGTDYFAFQTLASGATGTVLAHPLNGIRAKSNFWWYGAFNNTNGWIAESTLATPTNPPLILAHPTNRIVAAGGSAQFSVLATGAALSYQWQKNGANLADGAHYSGAGNPTLTISQADESHEGSYRCVVSNPYGSSNSLSASLTVLTPPSPPGVLPASSITHTSFVAHWTAAAGATGYRFDVSTNASFANYLPGGQNLDVGNVTNRSVSGLSSATTYFYRVRAYNSDGTSGNSATMSVTTDLPPPWLGVLRAEDAVVLFWPTGYAAFVLEAAPELPATNWAAIGSSPAVVGGFFHFTNTPGEAARYFRLRRP
ncbi:MAG: phosphodiester glycosidase family protein [Verrucomicrobiales bacterium]|nr:phosphodiester glycosidase family protein [Verrucomicrobiales bacterium]